MNKHEDDYDQNLDDADDELRQFEMIEQQLKESHEHHPSHPVKHQLYNPKSVEIPGGISRASTKKVVEIDLNAAAQATLENFESNVGLTSIQQMT